MVTCAASRCFFCFDVDIEEAGDVNGWLVNKVYGYRQP